MSCPFAKSLGVPLEGFHSHRTLGVATNDVVGTIGLALITSYAFDIDLTKSMVGWFVGAEIMHYAFGVDTAVLKALKLSPKCD